MSAHDCTARVSRAPSKRWRASQAAGKLRRQHGLQRPPPKLCFALQDGIQQRRAVAHC